MIRFLAAALLLTLPFVAAPVLAQGIGPPPTMVSAKLGEAGSLEIQYIVLVPVQKTEVQKISVTEFREEVLAGVTRKIPVVVEKEVAVVVTQYVVQQRTRITNNERFHVRDLAGKKVEGDALAKAFEKPSKALLLGDGQKLDSFYAGFFKPETLVIYEKAAAPAAAVPPMVIPPAPPDVPPAPGIRVPRPVPAPRPAP